MDIFKEKSWLKSTRKRIETERAGVFTFEPALDADALQIPLQRVIDAQRRFRKSPLSQVANELGKEVVVSSVFGTNTIEGGALDEEQTQLALNLDPAQVQEEQQRRVLNIKAAYDLARECAEAPANHYSAETLSSRRQRITASSAMTDNSHSTLSVP